MILIPGSTGCDSQLPAPEQPGRNARGGQVYAAGKTANKISQCMGQTQVCFKLHFPEILFPVAPPTFWPHTVQVKQSLNGKEGAPSVQKNANLGGKRILGELPPPFFRAVGMQKKSFYNVFYKSQAKH